jgi:hypothetical protein
MRIESHCPVQTKNGAYGWLHRLKPTFRQRIRQILKKKPKKYYPPAYWHKIAVSGVDNLGARIRKISRSLGLSENSLKRLMVGWHEGAYCFPMYNGHGSMCGMRLRSPSGKKWCIKGSTNGLFWPLEVDQFSDTMIFVCEGPTDTAAMLDLGFNAIGRPDALSGLNYVVEWLSVSRREIVHVCDRDEVSVRGAVALGKAVKPFCPAFHLLMPPAKYKDIRAWKIGGATKEDILCAMG